MDISGKKVLLIAPRHHYLEEKIIETIQQMGAEVTFFSELPHGKIYSLMRKFTFSPINTMLDQNYFNNIIHNTKINSFDIVFLIRGGPITTRFLEKLKGKLPNATFVMYQWDSHIHNSYVNKIKFFKKVFTFDALDAKKMGIKYLPLFFADEYAQIADKIDNTTNDIVFIGTYHSDRLNIVKKVSEYARQHELYFWHHLYISAHQKYLLWMKGKIPYTDLKYLKTSKVSLEDIVKLYESSKIVLDIEMTNQTGLTLRTLEALGANRKLLTTNTQIEHGELYDKNFIQILDRDNIFISKELLELEAANPKYKKYHIKQWLENIFIDL